MDTLIKARKVADYVAARWRLPRRQARPLAPVSENVAAIMVDVALQAGVRYRTVVLPRVRAVAAAFPGMRSLNALEQALETPEFARAFAWRHPEKPRRLRELVALLRSQGLETIDDIRRWLASPANRPRFLTIRGMGQKTFDYLSKLVGLPAIAVDRHAVRLLRDVGVVSSGYLDAKRILEFAADLLRIGRGAFDRLMWESMAGR